MASTYELIETTTLSSSASSVTFTSITQDYRDLVLVVEASSSSSNFLYTGFRFNSDSGSNYYGLFAQGNGSSATSFSYSSQSYGLASGLAGIDDTETVFSILQIMDYSATDKHKSVLIRENNDVTAVGMWAWRWADTTAISSLELFDTNEDTDLAAGSRFSLFGIAS